jgi:GntR family transcriptional repressor for pyruvate dehydrogenase complex
VSTELNLGGTTSFLEPVRLRNAGEHVADRLVTAIALGEFVPGQRLPTERDLAAMLGVSRTTVREAIHRLAALGYVEVRRGRAGGAYVQHGVGPEANEMIRRTLLPGWEGLELLFDLRHLLEGLIARTAAQRRTDEDAKEIVAALDRYREAGQDREASRLADRDLHTAVAAATHNPYLASLSDQIRREISLGFGAEPYSKTIRAKAVKDHTRLADAVIAGDASAAARIANAHFRLTEETLRELRERVGSDDEGSPG